MTCHSPGRRQCGSTNQPDFRINRIHSICLAGRSPPGRCPTGRPVPRSDTRLPEQSRTPGRGTLRTVRYRSSRRGKTKKIMAARVLRRMPTEKEHVALVSIAASAALTIAKAFVGFATGSLAILSEAGHSLIDFGATVMTYVAVRISGKPADEEHHYGHGKVEAVSALAETALLFLLSGIVIWEAVNRLIAQGGHAVEATIWAFGVVLASIIIDFFRARALSHTAEQTSSHALEADALHFSSDLWSSLAVLIGLVGVHFGLAWADSVAALVVALLVCVAGWRLGKRTVDTLTDVAPRGAAEKITAIAAHVPGVVRVEQVRARAVGEQTFIDLGVAVSRTLPLDRVSALKDQVAAALRQQIPGAEPVVTTDPVALNNETILDRVMVIARNRALAVHHVTVHELRDKLAVSLDLE